MTGAGWPRPRAVVHPSSGYRVVLARVSCTSSEHAVPGPVWQNRPWIVLEGGLECDSVPGGQLQEQEGPWVLGAAGFSILRGRPVSSPDAQAQCQPERQPPRFVRTAPMQRSPEGSPWSTRHTAAEPAAGGKCFKEKK